MEVTPQERRLWYLYRTHLCDMGFNLRAPVPVWVHQEAACLACRSMLKRYKRGITHDD